MNVSSLHHLRYKYSLQQHSPHLNELRGRAALNISLRISDAGLSGWHLPFSGFIFTLYIMS